MTTPLLGIHHVTAIVDDPQANVDFYAGLLGLRLIKQTVNFDDPYTYHLYYGDETGSPGTILTFFPWAAMPHGVRGTGQATAYSFAVPTGSLAYWQDRLTAAGARMSVIETRFGAPLLSLYDPAGQLVELVERPGVERLLAWSGSSVPAEYAIRGFAGVSFDYADPTRSAQLLTEVLGFQRLGTEGNRTRYTLGDGLLVAHVDLIHRPGLPYGRVAIGSIHHIAWRVADDQAQQVWLQRLRKVGVDVTDVRDRNYFHSIYFREPGGALFEIATDTPGFAVDESLEELGQHLKLPAWYEPHRAQIEQVLQPLQLPNHG